MISTILILILIALLIWVAISYYKQPTSTLPINTDYINAEIIDTEGDTTEVIMSGTTDEKDDGKKATDNIIPKDKMGDVIVSDSKTSDAEKTEILDNIDSTLSELLDVVDKVQPVDETRLIVDEGEVQE
jgi:membrane protein involved in colicin uptake